METERLRIRMTDRKEMEDLIGREPDEILKTAYTEMLDGCLRHPGQWEWYAVWMIERKDGTRVGDLSFKGLREDGSVEIGYGILGEFRGQGYASEAVGAAVEWALGRPGVTRVEAEAEEENTASLRVLEKCGFRPTGKRGPEGPRFERTR